MAAHIAHFVTYSCPRCRTELEAEEGGWQGWLRCPACDAPALPPEILLGHPATTRRVIAAGGAYVPGLFSLDTDEEKDEDDPNDPDALLGPPPSPVADTFRIVFLGGLVISLFILLVAYLDENSFLGGLFGALAFVFFLLLLRVPSRRRVRRED